MLTEPPKIDRPIHPGKFIRENLLNKMSQTELADKLGVTRQLVNMLVHENRPVTPRLAMQLGEHTDQPTEFWLKLQKDWDHWTKNKTDNAISITSPRLLVDGDILFARDSDLLNIEPFNREHLQKASYDFTLDQLLIQEAEETRFPEKGHEADYLIEPQTYMHGCTQEVITLSNLVVARLGQTSDLLDIGIVVYLGLQIDPGYNNKIYFTLENKLQTPVELSRGTTVLSIEFYYLANQPLQDIEETAGSQNGSYNQMNRAK